MADIAILTGDRRFRPFIESGGHRHAAAKPISLSKRHSAHNFVWILGAARLRGQACKNQSKYVWLWPCLYVTKFRHRHAASIDGCGSGGTLSGKHAPLKQAASAEARNRMGLAMACGRTQLSLTVEPQVHGHSDRCLQVGCMTALSCISRFADERDNILPCPVVCGAPLPMGKSSSGLRLHAHCWRPAAPSSHARRGRPAAATARAPEHPGGYGHDH